MGRLDIGNVRGVKGDKGERGDRGWTPSYDDLKYVKQNNEFVGLKTNKPYTPSDKYVDSEGRLCDENGYLLDENGEPTSTKGTAFDVNTYGYDYFQLYIDEDGIYVNSKGIYLNSEYKPKYVESTFIIDILERLFGDAEAYGTLVNDIYPNVVNTLTDENSRTTYKDFYDAIEGDIKYYVCVDNPRTTITLVNGVVDNTCKYYSEYDNSISDDPVPLEKNALYLYSDSGVADNDVMHYDIYVCLKAGTVPVKLVSSADFSVNYNVIDGIGLTDEDSSSGLEDEKDVYLSILTRGARGQFYNINDVDNLFYNNLINKLGAVNGIAQLNGSGKVPSSQLPAFVDDVIEGTFDTVNGEVVFTPSNNDYIGNVKENGKIYVDVSTGKATSGKSYRWSGTQYTLISNPVVVDDGGTNAYAHNYGDALETIIGKNKTLNTSKNTIIEAINDLDTDKEDKSNKVSSWSSPTNNTHYPTEKLVKDTLDTKAPTNHASTGTTYGKGTASNYGHVKAGNSTPSNVTTGDANVGTDDGTYARADHTHKHPTMTAVTGKPTSNQTPSFGGNVTVSQITSDGNGHVSGATDRTIKIPDTEASASGKGLMTSAQFSKLNNIEEGATKTTKTSDLTNDGDGTNVFVKNNDSRLTDARTPKSHTHGSISNTGTLNSDISNVNKIVVTDSNNNIKTISTLPVDKVTHPTITYTPTKTSGIEIGTITINGTSQKIYQQDNNTTYPDATTSTKGIVQLTSAVNSTSTTTAATPSAVKQAYDLANGKSTVSYTPIKTGGIAIGTLTIDGTSYTLYQQDNGDIQGIATTTDNGLMSSTDKVILDRLSDVQDNLTSTATNKPLSANQGKELKDLIDDSIDDIKDYIDDTIGTLDDWLVR